VDNVDWWSILSLLIGGVISGVITSFFAKRYYEHASRELEREAARLRRETERVRHNSRATITWLKDAGLIDPKVDPDTGEYLDMVGSQRDIPYNTEAAPEDTRDRDDTEDLPPEDQPPHSPGPRP
jgi:hypothetical protein